jgi:hypothetical protein
MKYTNILLLIGLTIFSSCVKEEIIISELNTPYVEPQNCDCGDITGFGTDSPMSDSLPFIPTNYWVQVENHCSQNTRRFRISQDLLMELADDSVACFYTRW